MNTMKKIIALLVLAISMFASRGQNLVICKGGCVNYFNTITSGTAVAWHWTFNGGVPGSSTQQNPANICYPDTGLFTTTIKTTFNTGTDTTQTLLVKVIEANIATIPIKDTAVCGPPNFTLNAGNSGYRYKWTTGNPRDTFQTLLVTAAGNYGVSVWSQCDSDFKQITVTVGSMPVVNLGPDLFVCNDEIVHTLDAGNAGSSYLWSTGETSQTIQATQSDTIWVLVTNSDGCIGRDEVILKDSCPPDFYFPNAFSPNNDGHNEQYKPYMKGIKSIDFKVWDRWGKLQYNSTVLNLSWDGKNNEGTPLISGAYIFEATLISNEGRQFFVKGDITILR